MVRVGPDLGAVGPVDGPFFGMVRSLFEKQGRILNPPPPGPTSTVVRPSRRGRDLENLFKDRDAHIRLEDIDGRREIYVVVFDSEVDDPDEAYVESDAFPTTPEGAEEATEFLRSFAFDVVVRLPGT